MSDGLQSLERTFLAARASLIMSTEISLDRSGVCSGSTSEERRETSAQVDDRDMIDYDMIWRQKQQKNRKGWREMGGMIAFRGRGSKKGATSPLGSHPIPFVLKCHPSKTLPAANLNLPLGLGVKGGIRVRVRV